MVGEISGTKMKMIFMTAGNMLFSSFLESFGRFWGLHSGARTYDRR